MTPEEQAEESRRVLGEVIEGAAGRAKYQWEIRRAAQAALDCVDAYERSREAELAAVRREFRAEVDRERERSVLTGRELAAEKARAIEARKAVERVAELKSDHSALRFDAPRGEYGRVAPWTVDDLERLLYDVRVSGGDGSTELSLSDRQVETRVPYPETVVAGRAAAAEPERTEKGPGRPTVPAYAWVAAMVVVGMLLGVAVLL